MTRKRVLAARCEGDVSVNVFDSGTRDRFAFYWHRASCLMLRYILFSDDDCEAMLMYGAVLWNGSYFNGLTASVQTDPRRHSLAVYAAFADTLQEDRVLSSSASCFI